MGRNRHFRECGVKQQKEWVMKTILYYILPALSLTVAGFSVACHQALKALRVRELRRASRSISAAQDNADQVAVATLIDHNRRAAELLRQLVEEAEMDTMVDLQIGDLDDQASSLLVEMSSFDHEIDRAGGTGEENQQRRLQGGL